MPFTLDCFAVHNLLVRQGRVEPIGAAEPSQLAPRVRDRLLGYLEHVADRGPSTGRATAAVWDDGAAPAALSALRTCAPSAFGPTSLAAMDRLLSTAGRNAKDGLVVFVRATDETDVTSLACLKLDLGEIEGVRWAPGQPVPQALQDVAVANLLPEARRLQKAAVIPSPDGAGDLRVVDAQGRATAGYWQRFLGASPLASEPDALHVLVDVSERALADLDVGGAQQAVSRVVALAAKRTQTTTTARFLRDLAREAGVTPARLIAAVDARQADLAPDVTVTAGDAQRLRTTYDLGDGMTLTGPRGVLEEHLTIFTDGSGRYVAIRVSAEPGVSHT
jgi:hypothetical protein